MQLIHLSTKEFLQKPQRSEDMAANCSEFLVDRSLTSLQLTRSCLAYISSKCCEPITDLGGDTLRIDICVDGDRLEQRLRDFPLSEYAVFSWAVHILDCDSLVFPEIFRAIRRTYESTSTFCWMETCLTLDPDSVWLISFDLEELAEWIDKAKSNSAIEFGEDGRFVEAWCEAILRLLAEYGGVISYKPFEVHFLDLSSIFVAKSLHGLYEKYAMRAKRETSVHVDGYINPFPCRETTSKDRKLQLQQNLKHPTYSLGFFTYDERRDVFLFAEAQVLDCLEFLCVQNRSTGRRLPPAFSLDKELNGAVLREAVLSTDGKFLGIPYKHDDRFSKLQRFQTSLWQIDDEIGFKDRTKRGSWAQRIINTPVFEEDILTWSYNAIVFGNDGCFYCPGAIINPIDKTQRSLRKPIDDCARNDKIGSAFSGDGRFLILLTSNTSARKVSTQGPRISESFIFEESTNLLTFQWFVSPTGRYLVFFARDLRLNTYDWTLNIYDTGLWRMKVLPLGSVRFNGGTFPKNCYFSNNESKLFGFFGRGCDNIFAMKVLIWEPFAEEPNIISQGSWKTRSDIAGSQISVQKDDSAAWLVTSLDREIQNIALTAPQITIHTNVEVKRYICCISSSISNNGALLCLVFREKLRAQVQVLDLTSTHALVRVLNLGLTDSADMGVNTSPDLGLIAIGGDVFHLGNEDKSLASVAFLRTPTSWEDVTRRFSSCNRYMTCTESAYKQSSHTTGYAEFAIFRLNLQERSYEEIDVKLPERMLKISPKSTTDALKLYGRILSVAWRHLLVRDIAIGSDSWRSICFSGAIVRHHDTCAERLRANGPEANAEMYIICLLRTSRIAVHSSTFVEPRRMPENGKLGVVRSLNTMREHQSLHSLSNLCIARSI